MANRTLHNWAWWIPFSEWWITTKSCEKSSGWTRSWDYSSNCNCCKEVCRFCFTQLVWWQSYCRTPFSKIQQTTRNCQNLWDEFVEKDELCVPQKASRWHFGNGIRYNLQSWHIRKTKHKSIEQHGLTHCNKKPLIDSESVLRKLSTLKEKNNPLQPLDRELPNSKFSKLSKYKRLFCQSTCKYYVNHVGMIDMINLQFLWKRLPIPLFQRGIVLNRWYYRHQPSIYRAKND